MKSIKKKMFSYILKRTKKNHSNSTRPDDYVILEEEEKEIKPTTIKPTTIKPTINELLEEEENKIEMNKKEIKPTTIKPIKPTINELLSKYNNFDLIDNEIKIIENMDNIPIDTKYKHTGLFIQQNPVFLGFDLKNCIFTGYLFKGIPIGIGILSTKYHGIMKGVFYDGILQKGYISNLPKNGSVYVQGQYRRLRNFFLDSLDLEVKILYNNGCIYEKNKKFFFPTNDKNKKLELLTEFSCMEFVFFLLSLSKSLSYSYKINTDILLNNNIDFNIFNSFLNDVDFLKYLKCLNINCIQAK